MQPTPSPLGGPLAGNFTQSFTGGAPQTTGGAAVRSTRTNFEFSPSELSDLLYKWWLPNLAILGQSVISRFQPGDLLGTAPSGAAHPTPTNFNATPSRPLSFGVASGPFTLPF